MKTIPIPGTGLEVSRLAYGCMNLGGSWDDSPLSGDVRRRAERVVGTALEAGISLFDHADIYCCGKSEEVFGDILHARSGLRSEIVIQTKCGIRFEDQPVPGAPPRYNLSRRHVVESVESSLRRLRTDYIDILLLHRPDPLAVPEEIEAAFESLQRAGKVRFFGVSNHSRAQLERLRGSLGRALVINQLQLSLLHSQLIWNGVAFNHGEEPLGGDSLDSFFPSSMLLQAWGPLDQGRLCGTEPAGGNLSAACRLVGSIAADHGVSREAVVTSWLLRLPLPVQPVLGTTTPERLRDCVEGLEMTLSRQEWYALFQTARGREIP